MGTNYDRAPVCARFLICARAQGLEVFMSLTFHVLARIG